MYVCIVGVRVCICSLCLCVCVLRCMVGYGVCVWLIGNG